MRARSIHERRAAHPRMEALLRKQPRNAAYLLHAFGRDWLPTLRLLSETVEIQYGYGALDQEARRLNYWILPERSCKELEKVLGYIDADHRGTMVAGCLVPV